MESTASSAAPRKLRPVSPRVLFFAAPRRGGGGLATAMKSLVCLLTLPTLLVLARARETSSSAGAATVPPVAPAASLGTSNVSFERQMAERLLALVEAEPDPARRVDVAEAAAKHIPRALLGAVLGWLQDNPTKPDVEAAMRGTMLRWAWEEPTGAAAWTLKAAGTDFRREALGIVAAGWAYRQPDALPQWAAQLVPSERDWVMLHGASYFARTDLEKFADWQAKLSPSPERDELLAEAAQRWARRTPLDVAALIARSSTDTDAAWRRYLADALAEHLAKVTEPSVVTAVLARLPPGAERKTVLTGVVSGWSARDPQILASWLDETPLRIFSSAPPPCSAPIGSCSPDHRAR